MTPDFLEYHRLMERAVRGVVREALTLVAEHGLPGLHHFYISFRTRAPGVTLPDSLLRQYPEEMTIVLEHQFWDLDVTDETFAVSLSFSGAQERLVIPFDAITGFVDPSVKFGLQFGAADAAAGATAPQTEAETAEAPPTPPEAPAADAAPPDTDDERVITLDRFRKK
jgi:hypothetical protein